MRLADLPKDEAVAVWVALIRASAAVQSAVQAEGKAAGFPPLEWYDVLWDLEQAADGRRPFELESRLLLAQYNLSRLIDRLEAAGYVVRRRCPSDGRGQVLVITAAGKALRKKMWPIYFKAIEQHIGAKLGENDARALCALLVRLTDGETRGSGECGTAAEESAPAA